MSVTTLNKPLRAGQRVRALDVGGMDRRFVGRVGVVREVIPAQPQHGVLEGLAVDFPDGSRIDCGAYQFEPL